MPLCHKEPARRGLWMLALVLYGIRLLAKQFLGTVLDIEVDQSGLHSEAPSSPDLGRGAGLQPSV